MPSGTDGVHLNAAILQIFGVAAQVQAVGGVLGEITEADPLHDPGDDVAPGLCGLTHKAVDCNRGRAGGRNGCCDEVAVFGVSWCVGKIKAAFRPFWRIQTFMNAQAGMDYVPAQRHLTQKAAARRARPNHRGEFFAARTLALFVMAIFAGTSGVKAWAQDAQGPLTPPPSQEHKVVRLGNEPEAPAPPSLPPEEIIRRFAQKEDEFLAARPNYGSRKTIRIEEFGEDGKPAGQFLMVTETVRAPNGQVINKVVQKPQSTLRYFNLETEDVKELDRIPSFPMTTSQLAKYDLKYIGGEQVDEVDCYIFKVKPKALDRAHAYLDGLIWVDNKYLEVVKTYGRWVNELGEVRSATLPFTLFETYRENVDGKYWFPDYARSDDTIHMKDVNVPVRLVIKWTDFKLLPAMAAPATAPATASPAPPGKPQSE